MRSLGQRIRELRKAKLMSLRAFAKQAGNLSAAFVSDVELGRRYPSGPVLEDMARVLDTSASELREFDTRAPIDELRRLSTEEPLYGFAFRQLIDKEISPEELLEFLEQHPKRSRKKKGR